MTEQSREAKIRKNGDILICSGYAVMAFGLWSIIRFLLQKMISPKMLTVYFEAGGVTDFDTYEYATLLFEMTTILLVVDLLFRVCIGRGAIREAKGGKKGSGYLVFAGIYTSGALIGDIGAMIRMFTGTFHMSIFITYVVDITTCIALVAILVSAFRIRKLRRLACS